MHRHTHSETGDMASARSSRAPSFSSDRPSVAGSVTFQMPSNVRPSPAYIAASVASQTVTDHHNAQLREDGDDGDELENAVFSGQALALLNAFLDHLLFAFLSSARSPSLTAIRPAIADVLKPRLAREATEAADEELEGLLAGEDEDEDEDEFSAQHGRAADKWDVEKMWKRTRLRIMVYTRLGELEDEDEEKFVQQERGLSMDEDEDDEAGLVSWASAIFLTSVVEYVAEQTLLVAGSAAFARTAAKARKLSQGDHADELSLERLVIEESDVEKIALNAALGRLWRTWRKRVRSPLSPLTPGRGVRSASSFSSLHRRKMSYDAIDGSIRGENSSLPERAPTETEIAANIPLPMRDNDVDEIEMPGLARSFDEDNESSGTETPIRRTLRPSSVIMLASAETFRRRSIKERPMSLPPPAASPFTVAPLFSQRRESVSLESPPFETPMEYAAKRSSFIASKEQPPLPQPSFETPMEYANKRKSYMGTEAPSAVSQDMQDDDQMDAGESTHEEDPDMVAFASATGIGFDQNSVASTVTDAQPRSDDEEAEVPSARGYDSEAKIMQSKRMSVGKHGPPGLIRTFSTRSSSLRSAQATPVATPNVAQHPEARSYLDDTPSTDDEDEHHPIGVARTSDIPVRSTPTPPADTYSDKGKYAAQGGYVEVQPRHAGPTSAPARNTPMPDVKPVVPERSVARVEPHKREPSNGDYAAGAALAASAISQRRQDVPSSKSRGASLPSLQEVDTHSINSRHRASIEVGPTPTTPQSTPAQQVRDTRTSITDRQLHRQSTNDSRRSMHGADGSPSSEKSGVKRVGSTASSIRKQSGNFNTHHNSRGSEASLPSQPKRGRMSEEDRQREFENLVNGEETVKFTLTPQTVRDFSESPVMRKAELHKPSSSNVSLPRVSADRVVSSGTVTSNPPTRSASRSKGPVPAPHKASPSRKVVGRQLAREPRIEQDSMRDLADFIRSTGPSPGQEKNVQPFVAISGSGPKSTNASSSSLGRKLSTKQNGTRASEGLSTKPRMNMEPRSPAGLSTGHDDLIDFIRQGPPSAPNGQPRIPRSVAPFRTTVDSDQFDTMLGGNTVESAYGSAASTMDSTQTVNSRTGLIPEPKVVQPAYSNTPQQLSGNMASNAEPNITRTRRRVKDPYAIDFSDDEDEEDEDQLTALPPPTKAAPAARQESLMDFLNGMDPPSTSKPQPFMLSEETIAAAKARANSSNSTLSSTQTATRNGPSTYGTISTTSVASDAPRAYKPRLQARAPAVSSDVRSSKSATSDLADFLRNSGPPEPLAPSPTIGMKEDGKKSRKFWRSKKTYGDLP